MVVNFFLAETAASAKSWVPKCYGRGKNIFPARNTWERHQWKILGTDTRRGIVRKFFCWDLLYETGTFSQNFVFLLPTETCFFGFIFVVLDCLPDVSRGGFFRRSWNTVDSNWRSWDCWAAVLSTRPRSSCWENNFGTSRYIVRLRNLDRKFLSPSPCRLPVSNYRCCRS